MSSKSNPKTHPQKLRVGHRSEEKRKSAPLKSKESGTQVVYRGPVYRGIEEKRGGECGFEPCGVAGERKWRDVGHAGLR
jgi:hypothetical protein